MRRLALLAVATLLFARAAAAQQKPLTLDDIYGPGNAGRFTGKASARLGFLDDPWVDDAHFLWPNDDAANPIWLKVDAESGRTEPLYDAQKVRAALAALPGIAPVDAAAALRRRPTLLNPKRDGFVVTIGSDLFFYDIGHDRATRLTNSPGAKDYPAFSPDGRAIAFVSGNDLFVTTLASPTVRPLTTGGTDEIFSGRLDWVYSEEIWGRGTYRAFWWSPDSSAIAFLQFNEKNVPTYPLVDTRAYHPEVEMMKYPKAGDPNPEVRIGVVRAGGGTPEWIDTSKYADSLIVNVGWTPDSKSVFFEVQNRTQTWLDVNLARLPSKDITTLFHETSKTWIERWDDESSNPVWLKDGSFLWLSERSGFRHLYHYAKDGTLLTQVTKGDWEVRSVNGLDASGDSIFFSGTERSVLDNDVYRINLDGSGMRRVSAAPGTHHAVFNPSHSLYLDSWTNVTTPHQVRLHRSSGDEIRTVEMNQIPALAQTSISTPEFHQVTTRDGFTMEAMMIKPPDFDPSKKYPVYQFAYGGPHRQTVVDSWGYSQYAYHQLLAQHGIIVWECDNRTASGKGAQSAWPLYKNFGELELRDTEDCLSWLKRQPYVDASRIGYYGYSFGGYMAAYALTHPSSFMMAISGGPVTDWRDYDTIYTERYMGLPADNPEGYKRSSPRFSASALHGQLLLIHDLGDDNVHLQNTVQFASELQNAGKLFQMMLYPAVGHGITVQALALHERQVMLDFTLKNLKP